MFINEYGDKNNPLVLLLAPMMVSGEDLYKLMNPYFKHNYHYIAPDQGGHGKAGAYIRSRKRKLAKLQLDFGEKDFDWKYSKKTNPIYMPEAEPVIRLLKRQEV